MFIEISQKYKSLDVLINNAAKQTISKWSTMTENEFDSVIDTNLKGSYYCMKHASNIMSSNSNITNILSIYYNKPRLDKYHYDASKSGLAQLTKEAALALGKDGITVNGIYPGYAITPMNKNSDHTKALSKNILKNHNIIKSETFAKAVISYIENFALITTGQILGVDGGRSLN